MLTKDKPNIVYFSDGTYSSFVLNYLSKIDRADFIIFDFGVLSSVELNIEFSHKSFLLKEIAALSKHFNCLCLVGVRLVDENKSDDAVLIFFSGKMLTISMYISDNSQTKSINFVDTKFGRIGALIANNATEIEFFQLASAYDVDILFCFDKNNDDKKHLQFCCSYANKKFGTNVVVLSKKKMQIFDIGHRSTRDSKLIFGQIDCKKKSKHSKITKNLLKNIANQLNVT